MRIFEELSSHFEGLLTILQSLGVLSKVGQGHPDIIQ